MGDLTVDAWINLPEVSFGSSGSDRMIVHKGNDGLATYAFSIEGDPAPGIGIGKAPLRFLTANPSMFTVDSSILTWEPNLWYQVAVVKSGSMISFYRDGLLVGTGILGGSPVPTPGGRLAIGANPTPDGVLDHVKAFVDEVEIFNRALSAAEIRGLADAGIAGKCKPSTKVIANSTTTETNGVEVTTAVTPVIEQVSAGDTITIDVPDSLTVEKLSIPLAVEGADISFTLTISDVAPPEISAPPVDTLALFLEVNGVGLDFSDPATFASNPSITFLVDKNIDADRIEGDPFNCPAVKMFVFNEVTLVWEEVVSVERHPSTDVGTDTPTTEDDRCEYIATTEHFSTFSVGGFKSPASSTSSGGGGPAYVIVDTNSPNIASYYWKPDVAYSGEGVTINANVIDDVSVRSAYIFYYGSGEDASKAHMASMSRLNGQWFAANIPGSEVKSPNISFWIVAMDAAGNSAKSSAVTVEVKQGQSPLPAKPSQKNLPAHVLEAIKPKSIEPVGKLEVVSVNGGKSVVAFPDKIVIKNTGNLTVDNIRIMLSPEISKSFRLSDPAVKSIEPNNNVTLTLELNGSPNKDMLGNFVGYSGELIVMAEHHSPITLAVNIGGEESSYLTNYMDALTTKAEQRYNKISMLNSILSKQPKTEHGYEVTTSDGGNTITS
ncbi:MAG: LamG domain-containing protein, partial [Nitrososphaerales archaeon]